MKGRRYRLVIEGELGPRFADAFEGMKLTHDRRDTVLVGVIRDQAHLHALLRRVASLGLTLVSAAPDDEAVKQAPSA